MQVAKKKVVQARIVTLLLVKLALALVIYVIWRLDSAPRTDDAYVYADTVNVAPEVSGRIDKLAVKNDQLVKQGDILFSIDSRPFEATLAKAQAGLQTLNAQIELTQRSVNAQKFAADAAHSSVERARAAAEQATDTLNRMAPLLNPGYVSAEQLDQARTAHRSAQAQLQSAVLQAQQAKAAVSGVEALLAQRAVLTAEIALAKLNLEFSTVRAPFNGRVLGLTTAAGQFAAAGRPVFTLADTRRWYVVANFRETELVEMAPGRHVQIYLLTAPSRHFSGIVESVGHGVYPDDGGSQDAGLPHVPRSINWVRVAQRFPVRILVDNADSELFRIGASAVAIISEHPSHFR
ncbi:multidrug transporter subunit MdtN [Undibacterium terreum]|uniref:Multidrug transporter subunit MdtN n=1 Tax=Undibacterium terreum TaxID=1224302 RepID=A0A916XN05_9BURK|nr:multidrug transporter subunit MdtN [Undibacterium terreum]GGC85944.1 multidrug transporter subunit MdtN [Undibacterium terreum]